MPFDAEFNAQSLRSGNHAKIVHYIEWKYEIVEGKVTITGLGHSVKASGDVVVPDEIDGCPVVTIGDSAFDGYSNLTSITLPDGVTSIGDSAFSDCSGLTAMIIPGNVKTIGDFAFFGCTGLEMLSLNKGLTAIGNSAFRDCESLKKISIPGTVTEVGTRMLYGCEALTDIYIVESLSDSADTLKYGNEATLHIVSEDVTTSGIPHSLIGESVAENPAFKALVESSGGNYDLVVSKPAANGKNTVGDCLIAGISPTDEEAKFEVSIEIVDGEPVVTYTPDLGQERVYITEGCSELGGEWKAIETDADKEGLRFFRVKVALP